MPKLRFKRDRVTLEEANEMIEKADSRMKRALVAFLYLTGCRISEALDVERKDLREEGNILYIRIPVLKRELGYDHVLPIGKESPFIKYLYAHAKHVKEGRLFPINRFKAWRILHNLNPDVWPHSFRHNRTNVIIGEGGTPLQLQIWMGWKLLGTADEYVKKSPHLIIDLAHKVK